MPVSRRAWRAYRSAGELSRRGRVRQALHRRRHRSRAEGQLVSRRETGAVLKDPAAIADSVVTMVTSGRVTAIDGTQVPVRVESVCVHGDSPGAVQIATTVRDRLQAASTEISA